MQRVAEEMNLSETAFLTPEENGYGLRWFTPTVEVELCGHATLASAHVLWEQGYLAKDQEAHFSTLSGWLHARQNDGWIEMDFPIEPVSDALVPPELKRALDVPFSYVGQSRFDYLIETDCETSLRAFTPNFAVLKTLPIRGVILTAPSRSPQYDFVSRFFAPGVGLDEDPVTGSAHCSLGPYWAARLNKKELIGYQCSRRGGVVRVLVETERVVLGGQAVTIKTGELSDTVINSDHMGAFSKSHS
jgi:predicted PhzF superfamily epimerase YddE/YHI9